MDERKMQFRIGLMVLAVLALTAFLLMMFGGHQSLLERFRGKNVFYVHFREAPGVTVDTPVQKSGIRIGRVTEVRLADEVDDVKLESDVGAVVTIEIDRNRRIFSDEVCRIRRSLLGDAVLEFVRTRAPNGSSQASNHAPDNGNGNGASKPPSPKAPPRQIMKSGSWLEGQVLSDPVQMVGNLEQDLVNAIAAVAQASREISEFVDKVSDFMGTKEELGPRRERLDKIMDTTLATMQRLEVLTENVNAVLGDEEVKGKLKEAVSEVPAVLKEARGTLDQMRKTLGGMDETVGLVNQSLRNIEGFTEPLGQQGPVVVERLEQGSRKLELLLDELYAVSRAINSQQGTLGQLIHNPELYDNMNQAAANMEDLTTQLRPIVRDARVFSDKIARHPELLGVRGVLQRDAGTKGVPRLSELQRAPSSTQTYGIPRLFQPR